MVHGKKFALKAALLCVVLTFALLSNLVLPVSAAEISSEKQATNIVAVVDCSSSMQVSDSNWKVPEALCMLVDMCPNESVRLSLVVYGTRAEIVFRDMPLSEENHETVKRMIHSAIMKVGYNRGQTDTGAALSLARTILEEQSGHNNMVMLFTDGAIKATHAGRTTQQSRSEVDSFAVFAQNNQIKVNTLGLFSPRSNQEEVLTSEEELAILKSKTGGEYRRIEDTGAIPEFVIALLEDALSVCQLDMAAGAQAAADGSGWEYSFSITDRYSDNITLIVPNPVASIQQITLTHSSGQSMTVEEWPGAERQTYARYNGRQGYTVVRLKKMDGQLWEGDYTVRFETKSDEAPALSAFYFYDINVHLELSKDQVGILQPVTVDLYLTTGDGYRIDDAEFLKSINVQLDIINLENVGAEVSQNADGADKPGFFEGVSEQMKLHNDSFRFKFVPQRATNYQLVVRVSNDRFVRTIRTNPVAVNDRLQIESSVMTRNPRKNSPVEIGAYLVQQDTHGKVRDAEFYRLSGASATITNHTTGAVEVVELETRADGNGLVGTFTPQDAGDYSVVVQTASHRENVQRTGETLNFSVVDRPIQLRKSGSLGVELFGSFIRGYHAGRELTIVGDEYFYDPDGESYQLSCSSIAGNGSEMIYDNVFYYQADRRETLTMNLTALDYSGNSVSMSVSIRILSQFEVIALTALCIVLAAALIFVVVCLVSRAIHNSNELKGTLAMEVILNGELPQHITVDANKYGALYSIPLVQYYIPLTNQIEIENPEDLLKPPQSFLQSSFVPHDLKLSRLMKIYAECYHASGYIDAVYRYLVDASDVLAQSENAKTGCQLRGRGKGTRFDLLNVAANYSKADKQGKAFLLESKKKKNLTECKIALPLSGDLNSDFQVNTGKSVLGLEIRLKYLSDEGVPKKDEGIPKKKEGA